jgi:hypothetical protein
MPSRLSSSADLHAVIAQVAPDVLTLLADRHPKQDVRRTLMRLAVTERLVEKARTYALPAAEAERG